MKNLRLEKFDNISGDIMVESQSVFSYKLHTHTYYEMILYEPFDGKITVNGMDMEINSMTATIISPLDFHQITVNADTSAKYIKIGFNADVLDIPALSFSVVLDRIARDSFLYSLFNEALMNSGNKPYLTRLIGCAVYVILNNGKKILSRENSRVRDIAVSALKVINEHFKEDLSLLSVAEMLSVTPQYLSYSFKQSLGVNFSQYLSCTRIKYAASMMENTHETITNICFESGFGNFSHFSRSFRKLYGISPREYRNKLFKK